jgi:hypothetical protein
MACHHKFRSYLQLERLDDFIPETLIIGTFNPEWPDGNYAEWFYGRTNNNYFWDLLPRMYGDQGLRNGNQKDWKTYCRIRKVALTDLLASINDANIRNETHRLILSKYTDLDLAAKFTEQLSNPIVPLLEANQHIRSVYLTTTNNSKFWQRQWSPVMNYCLQHKIWCRRLLTPSKGARFSMTKGSGITMPDFIFKDWNSKWNRNE